VSADVQTIANDQVTTDVQTVANDQLLYDVQMMLIQVTANHNLRADQEATNAKVMANDDNQLTV